MAEKKVIGRPFEKGHKYHAKKYATLDEELAARKADRAAAELKHKEKRALATKKRASDASKAKRRAASAAKTREMEKKSADQVRHERLEQARAEKQQKDMAKAKEQAEWNAENSLKRELASRELARKHLIPFILKMHPSYLPGWVHKDIAFRLERFSEEVALGLSPRLMIQMPPRAGKSQEASIDFPAWHLGKYPHHEIIMSTYSGSLALGFSRKARSVVDDAIYRILFPKTRLDPKNQNAEGWLTTKGGGFVPAGVGGAITGKGAHVLIIDDPVKNAEEAESETTRQSVKDWYTSTAYTRLAPGGGVLIIQTRWHEDDLSGWLESQAEEGQGDDFEIVRYPAIAIHNETYRRKGQALHPARYDLPSLQRIKNAVGPRVWDALYQQQPTSDEGGYFDSDMLSFYDEDELPDDLVYYTAWDFAIGKKERNDYTVGITVGIDKDNNIWIVDFLRKRMDTYEIVDAIIDRWETWHEQLIAMEKGHISMAMGPYMEERISERKAYGLITHEMNPGRRDKELRARAIQGRMRQGKVKIPRAKTWTELIIKELMSFPFGTHDDIVDTLAWIGLMLQEMDSPYDPPPKKKPSWRDKLRKYATVGGNTKSPMAA